MDKFKDKIKSLKKTFKDNLLNYIGTLIVVGLTTIIAILGMNYLSSSDNLRKTLLTGILCAFTFFTCESIIKRSSHGKRILCYILGPIISTILANIWVDNESSTVMLRINIGYMIATFFTAIYFIIKNSKVSLSEYLIKTGTNIVLVQIIYGILTAGISTVYGIFAVLLLRGLDSYEFLLRIHIFLLGFIFIPACIMALTNVKQKIYKIIKGIVLYLLVPISILSTAIILIYVLKVFILRTVPSNSIYRITAGIFAFSFPVLMMAKNFKEENKFFKNYCEIMPYTFIVFVGFQIYSIAVRCIQNGLTPVRYLGIMFIIFEIITIILLIIKKGKYEKHIITSFIVLTIISTIIPGINMERMSAVNQASRLKRTLTINKTFSLLNDEEKQIASGAYKYLYNDYEELIPEYIDSNEKSQLLEYNTYSSRFNYENEREEKVKYIYYDREEFVDTNIEGFDKLMAVSIELDNEKIKRLENDIEKQSDEFYKYIKDMLEKNVNDEENINEYIEEHEVFDFDEKNRFILTGLTGSYEVNKDGNIVKIYSIKATGYSLTKTK